MDTIRSYLDSIFCRFPGTPEYLGAKRELLQRMEEKYRGLLDGGSSENEAVGAVIAEIGNAEAYLKGKGLLRETGGVPDRGLAYLTGAEAQRYYTDSRSRGTMTGLGVLFILMGAGLVTGIDGLIEYFDLPDKAELVGVAAFFMLLLPAVFLFIFSGMSGGQYRFIKEGRFYLDQETREQIIELKERLRPNTAGCVALGVGACILGVVAVLVGELLGGDLGAEIGSCLLLHLVGVGVLLFVHSGCRNSAIDRLLKEKDED